MSINRVVLVGRTTNEVKVSKTNSGLSVASFTVAVDRFKKEDGADFINCVAWRQAADFLGTYCEKGMRIGVDGRLQTRTYERDGRTVYVTEVVADSVQILENKRQDQPKQEEPKQEEPKQESKPSWANSFEINDSDLPF